MNYLKSVIRLHQNEGVEAKIILDIALADRLQVQLTGYELPALYDRMVEADTIICTQKIIEQFN